ncbi:MAG: alpha-galactosidase [Ilumatobacteraceae bacterium]
MAENLIHLRRPGISVVVDVSAGVPVVAHWGRELETIDRDSILKSVYLPKQPGGVDVTAPIAVVPQHGDGCFARPGLAGHRPGGRFFAPRFSHSKVEMSDYGFVFTSTDSAAELGLRCQFELRDSGVLAINASVTNHGDSRYLLDTLSITLPIPSRAKELVTLTGSWAREFAIHRQGFLHGAWTSENRTGRTSHEHPPVVWAVETNANEWHGEVWGAHLAWSGNHVLLAEVLADSRKYLQLGELLMAGEVCLEPGGSYSTPEVLATYSQNGLTPASLNFHRNVRANLPKQSNSASRKVLLNTWEAVYFNQDEEKLRQLAELAARVGVERFVLDDGWFAGRRNDKTSLGDWWVSPEIYPNGLAPLISHVRKLGMDFGIWVEPEMISEDSELFRMHPDWALVSPDYEPVRSRNQLVLNLVHAPAYEYVFSKLDKLLSENEISFIKWDMNRPHVQATLKSGAAGTREQTLAFYKLVDQLREKHRHIEIESCSSGGGRIDHEILRRTDRVWTSDCIDPYRRQKIQRGASMFIPNEVMGAHIGAEKAHTTSRVHSLEFRAISAVFGHLGLELDLTICSQSELQLIKQAIDWHKKFRGLLHSGDAVRFDCESASQISHGVYSQDRNEALVSLVQLTETKQGEDAEFLRLPGLDSECRYRVAVLDSNFVTSRDVGEYTGQQLANTGLKLSKMRPETGTIFHLLSI